ncbi:unnamed protein product [Sphagnum troendelagicum]|uniref:Arf-GAP domain-containing protein n=1 Tax=Sphagnum troendelagicum TaxID=128251 RepID=A0ABP0V079_9BRYO
MGSRVKEDEKNEMIIRRLLKLPENKRCINCGSQGPQYVCTNFSTFVCTQCSGVHREFTHRIKSISMAKFTTAEVVALQQGGNERARSIFFKSMDPVRNPLPDSSDINKLRDFIKHVYVEKRFSGDRPVDDRGHGFWKPEEAKGHQAEPRSLSFDDRVGDRQPPWKSDIDEKRSSNRSDPERWPARHSYDEHDRPNEERSSNDSNRERRKFSRPFSLRDFDFTPPPVQSVKDILGDNVPPLRVEYRKKEGADNDFDSPALGSPAEAHKNQRSQSMGALTGRRSSPTSAAPAKMSNSGSFIDFNEEPAPTSNAPAADLVVESSQETTAPSNSTDWATFNSATLAVAPPPPGYPEMPAPKNDQVQWSATAWPSNSGFIPWSLGVTSHSPSSLQKPKRKPCWELQDFFVPTFLDPSTLNAQMQQQAHFPGFHPAGQQFEDPFGNAYVPGVMPGRRPTTARTRNPFDDDDDDDEPSQNQGTMTPFPAVLTTQQAITLPAISSTMSGQFSGIDESMQGRLSPTMSLPTPVSTSLEFPSMDSLQAALPPVMPWSNTVPQYPLPPNSTSGSVFGGQMTHNMMPSPMLSVEASGMFAAGPSFPAEASYPGTQLYTQTIMRPAGYNPFA